MPLDKLKILATQISKRDIKPKAPQKQVGRQATRINFGVTQNINVAKILIQTILRQEEFHHLEKELGTIKWNDYKAVTVAFKQLLSKLEKTVI